MNLRDSRGWRRTRRLLLAVGLAAAAFPLAATSATGAGGAGVDCGATLTSDLVLTKDLRCNGDGLSVVGDDLTIDLNGHTIRGSGTGTGVSVTGARVTVRNGVVRGFQAGVSARYSGDTPVPAGDVLSDLQVSNNALGVSLGAEGGTLENSKVTNNTSDGVSVRGHGWTITRNDVSRNGDAGITARNAGASILGNTVNDNFGNGIEFLGLCDGAVTADNTVARNGGIGIWVIDSTSRTLRNTVRSNGGSGIVISEGSSPIFLPNYLIAGNSSDRNGGNGISVTAGMIDGGGNTARNNALTPDCVNLACA